MLMFSFRTLLHRAHGCLRAYSSLPAGPSPSLAAALQPPRLSVGGHAPAVFNEP